MDVQKFTQRRNGMSDFRENGLKRYARLESKKSVISYAVKTFCAAEWLRNSSGGRDQFDPPPPVGLELKMLLCHFLPDFQWQYVRYSNNLQSIRSTY